MGELLLITDDLRRGDRLARDLGTFRACRVHDLYEAAVPSVLPELIVGDVSALTSDAVLRMQRILKAVRGRGVPFLFLTHGNAARAEAQARVLGASGTLAAGAMTQALLAALEGLHRHEDPSAPAAVRHAGAARRFLADVFVPGRPVTPAAIDTGTGLIARAVAETGVRDWVLAVRRFDDATHQHCLLVAGLAASFAAQLGFAAADRHRLAKAALLHDVGKIHVPAEILNKPGRLTEAETAVMRQHPAHGHAMLAGRGFEAEMLAVVRSHHELLDGSGYPDGLKGAEIPDLVRLVTVCDIYAALTERRSYKPPMAVTKALGILDDMVGRLDGDLVQAFHPVARAIAA
ncbi:HD domain-containing protein [Methylobacterium sp. NEAU 140]|nr:HD domain-containing phosphohydrolase [Methylobacterium sp. NEAU 140]MDP4027242.1 HD domain-containing protein [Methylobacterium sp. NEAU 140]